jgi:hypothetical protein
LAQIASTEFSCTNTYQQISGGYFKIKNQEINCNLILTVFLATFERDNGMHFGNAEVAAILILHVNLLDTVLKCHSVLNFCILVEAEGCSVIHFAIISRFKL